MKLTSIQLNNGVKCKGKKEGKLLHILIRTYLTCFQLYNSTTEAEMFGFSYIQVRQLSFFFVRNTDGVSGLLTLVV